MVNSSEIYQPVIEKKNQENKISYLGLTSYIVVYREKGGK